MHIVDGDLLDQPVEVIVNAWNRNVVPWWLLIPQGVSGAIKRRGGYAPFRELARHGPIPLGQAARTGAGKLPFKAIIHVAGIDLTWRSSERSIRASVRSALAIAEREGFASIALPLIGAGTGGGSPAQVQAFLEDETKNNPYSGAVYIVRHRPAMPPTSTAAAGAAHGWGFWLAAALFGVVAPVFLMRPIGLGAALFGLEDPQLQLLVLSAVVLLVAAAPLRTRPAWCAFAAGGHALGAGIAAALAAVNTPQLLPAFAISPILAAYVVTAWLTAAVFARRAWVLWRRAAGVRRAPLAALALAIYLPALPLGHALTADWDRVRPLLGSARGEAWEDAVSEAWWLTRLGGLHDFDLAADWCSAAGDDRVQFGRAAARLFGREPEEDLCWWLD